MCFSALHPCDIWCVSVHYIPVTSGVFQCMACGPGGIGQCVGPSICCGPGIGCMMGTPEAEVCQKENESTTPCSVRGQQCGIDDLGNCVADGICCVEGESRHSAKRDAAAEVDQSTQNV